MNLLKGIVAINLAFLFSINAANVTSQWTLAQMDAGIALAYTNSTAASDALAVSNRVTAIDARTNDWNTAYGWGDHAGLYPTISAFNDANAGKLNITNGTSTNLTLNGDTVINFGTADAYLGYYLGLYTAWFGSRTSNSNAIAIISGNKNLMGPASLRGGYIQMFGSTYASAEERGDVYIGAASLVDGAEIKFELDNYWRFTIEADRTGASPVYVFNVRNNEIRNVGRIGLSGGGALMDDGTNLFYVTAVGVTNQITSN